MKHTPPDVAVQAGNPNTGYSCGPITKYTHRGDVTDAGKNDCTHGRAQGTAQNDLTAQTGRGQRRAVLNKAATLERGGSRCAHVCVCGGDVMSASAGPAPP